MLKVLLKKQMTEIFRAYFYDAKKNKARSRGTTIAYMFLFVVLMVGLLGGIFAFVSLSLCGPLAAAGMDWLYFLLMGLMAVVLGAFGSVFNTYSSLYLAKDNDLLLSLPIPVRVVMASRLLSVYLIGLMYSAVVIVPAAIVYWIVISADIAVILGSLLLMFMISVHVLMLSCALGWVVAKISLKLKNKSLITVVISLVFIGGYYFLYFKAQTLIQVLIQNAAEYGEKIKGAAYPLYLFGRMGTGDGLAMLVMTVGTALLFGLLWWLIARSFLKIATASAVVSKRRYRATAVKEKSPSAALLRKEFRRFLASPNYILNCGLGILMLPLGGFLLLWKGRILLEGMQEIFELPAGAVPILLAGAMCMLASMNDMTAPSVSLEGKNLWLLQSLPVTPWQALRAKLWPQLLLTGVPLLVCIVCTIFVYTYTPVELILVLALTLSFTVFSALFGLFLGLKMPNLNWTSEITPIKQSIGVMLALFSGSLYTVVLYVGFFMGGRHLGFVGYASGFTLLTLILDVLLYTWMRKKGTRILAAL